MNRLYGDPSADVPSDGPTDIDTMNRDASMLPEHVPGIELVDSIAQMDRETYRAALKDYGVSDKQLAKLKALDGLAANGGRLLSVSLQMTHQNYVGQLHNLAEVADDIRERLMPKKDADGNLVPMNAEDYSYLAKVYVECVKEAGKGYGLMMTGTEAMVRMMTAAKADKKPDSGKATAGWGPMKKVRKA